MNGITTARIALLTGALLLPSSAVSAANMYVRPGAAGTSTGLDWANACTGFTGACHPTAMVRGNVYYVADGDYRAAGPLTLKTPVLGTTLVTIRKATAANHGTATGWSDTYGDGQAMLSAITIETNHWLVDGATRNEANWKDYNAYGFRIDNRLGPTFNPVAAVNAGNSSNTVSFVTFRYLDVVGSRQVVQGDSTLRDSGFRFVPPVGAPATSLTVSRSSARDVGFDNFQIREVDNVLIEYTYVARNDIDPALVKHTQGCDCSTSMRTFTIRYNWFEDIVGTAFITNPASSIAARSGSNGYSSDWYIYGNVFSRSGPDSISGCTSGVIRLLPGEHRGDFVVVQNTILGVHARTCSTTNQAAILFDVGGEYRDAAILVKNNLFVASTGFTAMTALSNTFGSFSWSHQSYVSMVGPMMKDENPSAEIFNIDTITLPVLIDYYALRRATLQGEALPAPYHIDRNGTLRGSDEKWDRGAFECLQCVPLRPWPPSNLRFIR